MTEHQRKGTIDLNRLAAELEREIVRQEWELYSDVVIHETRHPSNLGRMIGPDGHGLVHGWCGDTMEIYLRLDDEKMEQATFMTHRFPQGIFEACELANILDDTANDETTRYRFLRTVSREIGQLWGCWNLTGICIRLEYLPIAVPLGKSV